MKKISGHCRHNNKTEDTLMLTMVPPKMSQRIITCLDCGATWKDVPCPTCGTLVPEERIERAEVGDGEYEPTTMGEIQDESDARLREGWPGA